MRPLSALAFMLSLLTASLSIPYAAVAQTESGLGPAIGEATTIYSDDGSAVGTITVDDLIDPFDGYDFKNEPQRSYRYALFNVTVSNLSSQPLAVDPQHVRVVDSEGFVSRPASIFSSGLIDPLSFLEYNDALAPGDSISGAIAFEVFLSSDIARVLHQPSSSNSQTILDLRSAPVLTGTIVPIVGSDGIPIAEIEVPKVIDPYEDYDSSSAPPRGSRYVLVEITLINTGTRTLELSQFDIRAVDRQGFSVRTGFVTSTDPDMRYLASSTIPPGATANGSLFFEAFADLPIVQISYGDGRNRNLVLADLVGAAPPVAGTPVATPVDPEPEPTADAVSSPSCDGLVAWGEDLNSRVEQSFFLTTNLEEIDAATLDPAVIRRASQELATMADAQRDSNPPQAAEALNTYMAENYFTPMASATEKLADALDSANTVAAVLAIAEAEGVVAAFEVGGPADILFDEIETACPSEFEILNNQ